MAIHKPFKKTKQYWGRSHKIVHVYFMKTEMKCIQHGSNDRFKSGIHRNTWTFTGIIIVTGYRYMIDEKKMYCNGICVLLQSLYFVCVNTLFYWFYSLYIIFNLNKLLKNLRKSDHVTFIHKVCIILVNIQWSNHYQLGKIITGMYNSIGNIKRILPLNCLH